MTSKELKAKTLRVVRGFEAQRKSARRGSHARAGDDDYPSLEWVCRLITCGKPRSDHAHTGDLCNRRVRVFGVETVAALLVQVPSIPRAETKPTPRINFHTSKELDRVVVECVLGPTNVLGRSKLGNGLKVFVDWKVNANSVTPLVRTIQKHRIIHGAALWIAVENVAAVNRNIDVLAESGIDERHQAKIADVGSRASAALQLIEAGRVIGLVSIPAIKRYDADAQRIVRRGKSNLGAADEVGEARLSIQSIDEGSIRQVRRRCRETGRHHDRI